MKQKILSNTISVPDLERFPADSGDLRPGQICLSNESRYSEAYFSEPLTTYLVGWKDPADIEGMMDFIAPPVEAPGRFFEFKKLNNSEEFYSETDDIRAVGADFKRVEYTAVDQVAKTINKGLTIRLDFDQYPNVERGQQQAVERLTRRLLRNEYRRCAAALVAAAGTPSAKTWSGSPTPAPDPDQDVLTALIAATNTSGVRPNRVLYNDGAWNLRTLAFRAQNVAGAYASASLTPDQLTALIQVEQIKVSKERYQVSRTAKATVFGNVVIGFYGEQGATMDDPSTLKRFWSPTQSGGKMRVYVQTVSAKLMDVTVEHYSNVISPAPGLGTFELTVS